MEKINISSGIIIDDNKRVLLIKRKYNLKYYPNHWSFPGGHNEDGESFEQALLREVKEETGLGFIIDRIYIENEAIIDGKKLVYFHRYLGSAKGKILIQESECDGYGWFSFNETKNLLIFENIREILEQLYKEQIIN